MNNSHDNISWPHVAHDVIEAILVIIILALIFSACGYIEIGI